MIFEYSLQRQPLAPTRWGDTLLADLRFDTDGSLREFLFAYGSDVRNPRASVTRLVDCFVGTKDEEDDGPSSGLAQVAAAFPIPTEATNLKRQRLSALASDPRGIESAWAATYFLLVAKDASAFDLAPFDFAAHARLMWRNKRADVLALLGRLTNGERSRALVKALADVIDSADLPMIWHEQPDALSSLLAHRPVVAASAAAWMMPYAGQQKLWESVHAATTDRQVWAGICRAMLVAQCAVAERETVNLVGMSLGDCLEGWLAAGNIRLPSQAWREALRPPIAAALQGGPLSPSLLSFAAWVITPREARSIPGNRSDVQSLVQERLASVPEVLQMPTLFWLAGLGFQTPGRDGLAILSSAFFTVYDTVAGSYYPREAWDLLASTLPELPFYLEWDRCRRLRKAMKLWLGNNSQLADAIEHAASRREHARLIRDLR
jgi:hypothetical protein